MFTLLITALLSQGRPAQAEFASKIEKWTLESNMPTDLGDAPTQPYLQDAAYQIGCLALINAKVTDKTFCEALCCEGLDFNQNELGPMHYHFNFGD